MPRMAENRSIIVENKISTKNTKDKKQNKTGRLARDNNEMIHKANEHLTMDGHGMMQVMAVAAAVAAAG